MSSLIRRSQTGTSTSEEYQEVPTSVFSPMSASHPSEGGYEVPYWSVTGTSKPIDPSVDYEQWKVESALESYKPFGMLGTGIAQNIRWSMGTGERTATADELARGNAGSGVDWALGTKQATWGTPEYFRKTYRDTFMRTGHAEEQRKQAKFLDLDDKGVSQAYRPIEDVLQSTYKAGSAGPGLRPNVNKYAGEYGYGVNPYREDERIIPLSKAGGTGAFRSPTYSISRSTPSYAFGGGRTTSKKYSFSASDYR